MATRAQSLSKALHKVSANMGHTLTPCQEMVLQRAHWRVHGKVRKATVHQPAKPRVVTTVVPLRKTFGQRMAAMAAAVLSVFKGGR